jgi:RsiW-degrading membrane proteinase PrsW (M82 family)
VILGACLLYATLAACTALVGWLVVRYDLYEREPVGLLGVATGLGAAAMFGVGQLQVAAIRAVHEAGRLIDNLELAVLAGATEEIAKLTVVAAIAIGFRRWFNEPIDGLIYGSFAGLGAAIEESIAVLSDAMPLAILPAQEPIRLAGHLVMGGIGGFGVGLLVVRTSRAWLGLAVCLFAAIVLHTLWDVVAFDAADTFRATRRVRPWHTGSAIVLMLGGMVAYRNLVALGTRMFERMKDEG